MPQQSNGPDFDALAAAALGRGDKTAAGNLKSKGAYVRTAESDSSGQSDSDYMAGEQKRLGQPPSAADAQQSMAQAASMVYHPSHPNADKHKSNVAPLSRKP